MIARAAARRWLHGMIKRALDILVGVICLAAAALPMLAIALAVRLTSRGPAIFLQRRAGWRGRPFRMWKFRTMRVGADPYGPSPHSARDDRLTGVGRLLRETSLDELPQIFNVLTGQMSLIGPRPLYERQAEAWNERQRRRLEVRPGITDYAQAFGRGGLTHEEKIELDLYYVDNRSFRLDFKIVLKTLANLFSRRGDVYEKRYSSDKERETD